MTDYLALALAQDEEEREEAVPAAGLDVPPYPKGRKALPERSAGVSPALSGTEAVPLPEDSAPASSPPPPPAAEQAGQREAGAEQAGQRESGAAEDEDGEAAQVVEALSKLGEVPLPPAIARREESTPAPPPSPEMPFAEPPSAAAEEAGAEEAAAAVLARLTPPALPQQGERGAAGRLNALEAALERAGYVWPVSASTGGSGEAGAGWSLPLPLPGRELAVPALMERLRREGQVSAAVQSRRRPLPALPEAAERPGEGLSLEQFDLACERDARRYGGSFQLY